MLPAVKVMAVFTQAAAPHAAAARIVCRLTFLDGWPLPRHTHTHTQAVHKVREAPAAKVCPPPPQAFLVFQLMTLLSLRPLPFTEHHVCPAPPPSTKAPPPPHE